MYEGRYVSSCVKQWHLMQIYSHKNHFAHQYHCQFDEKFDGECIQIYCSLG